MVPFVVFSISYKCVPSMCVSGPLHSTMTSTWTAPQSLLKQGSGESTFTRFCLGMLVVKFIHLAVSHKAIILQYSTITTTIILLLLVVTGIVDATSAL